MKRFFKNWAGRHSPSPRKPRSSRRRHPSRRADVREHEEGIGLPNPVPLTFVGYQQLPDGRLQPIFSAVQPATFQAVPASAGDVTEDQVVNNDDELVNNQHFCVKCGRARSTRYHMDNPTKPGCKPTPSCCTRCRRKNSNSDPCLKYLQHFCADCGKVRSRSYHKEHPVRTGQKSRSSSCMKCRTDRKHAMGEDGWEDIDADDTILALPRIKPSTTSFHASVEQVPPTPPNTPPMLNKQLPTVPWKLAPVEKKPVHEVRRDKVPVLLTTQTAPSARNTGPGTATALVQPPKKEDCSVHVVYVHPPCYHHGHDDHGHSSRHRADSNTTGTSSRQSRRVAFATPEISSRHEADADYDRTAVPENHEDPSDLGLNGASSRDNNNGRGFNPDRRPRRSPTPGPVPGNSGSSRGPASCDSGYNSHGEFGQPRMDDYSPPPEYSAPPPKVFTPEEIRRLWEQDPQPERPSRRQAPQQERGDNGPAPVRDCSAQNRQNFAANQRSFSEGDYPRGDRFPPSAGGQSSHRPADRTGPDYGRSDNCRASDGRPKNDENIDPKTRYNGYSNSHPSQQENRNGSSQQNPNMYNNSQNNEYNNTRPSQSRGPSSSENNPNMSNSNQSNGSRPSQSRTSNWPPANNPRMHSGNADNGYPRTRPRESQPDRQSSHKYESKQDNSRQTSSSTFPVEAPFTASERLWTDNPEHARKLREATERLERAAAANTPKTAPVETPPTPELGGKDSPNVSMPGMDSARPGMRNFSSATFGSDKPGFASDTRNFSADFNSTKPSFGSTRNFTSTTRDFSPNIPPDFIPPHPSNFPPCPPPFSAYRNTPSWGHTCHPGCNEFCPDRADHIAREVREIDSDEENEILGVKKRKGSRKGSAETVRKVSRETRRRESSDRARRLALVRLPRAGAVPGASPARSVGSSYYTASEAEANCY